MLNYNKNELIDECLTTYYNTFRCTLDTGDYVPEKFNYKILNYIFKSMKRQFRKINKEDKRYQRELVREERSKRAEAKKKARLEAKRARKLKKDGVVNV